MGISDELTELEDQGLSSDKIIQKLQEDGFSPKEINDALNRSNIKKAVTNGNQGSSSQTNYSAMEPSIMGAGEGNQSYAPSAQNPLVPPTPSSKYPTTKEISSEQPQSSQQYYYGSSSAPQNDQEYQGYNPPASSGSGYGYGQDQSYGYATDTDTVIEIAEQVFAEKMKDPLEDLEKIGEFKTLAQTKIDNISDRLKRIESQIDSLQSAILEKVGSYGRGLDGVKKELGMVEDSFGKVVNNLSGHSVHKIQKKTTVVHKKGSKKK